MNTAEPRDGAFDVPFIDVTPFVHDGSQRDRAAVAAAVDRAARTVGFMQVTGHGIPDGVLAAFSAATDAFFALDPATKARYRCPPGVNRGYSPPRSESLANSLGLTSAADLFEAMNVGVSAADHARPDLPAAEYPPNTWPAEVPGFKAAVDSWFAEAGRVARTMTRVFGHALGVGEDYFSQFTRDSGDVLRMINYRLPSADVELEPDQVGMGAHTDYGIVTVLWADPVPGLQILDCDGAWHPVQPAPGALLLNLGDAMARWTNDDWMSTMHRVAAPRVDGLLVPRRSAAFFHGGHVDAVISCLPGHGTPRYQPVTVGDHLRDKLTASRSGRLATTADREAARLRVRRAAPPAPPPESHPLRLHSPT